MIAMLLKKGSRDQEVAELQQALGIDADGVLVPALERRLSLTSRKMAY